MNRSSESMYQSEHSPRKHDRFDDLISQKRIGRLTEAFKQLDVRELQLLTCALAGNHPPQLADLRRDVIKALAKAERGAFNA